MTNVPTEALVFRVSTLLDVRAVVASISGLSLLHDASDIDRTLISTIISELGTNIVKYAGRGKVHLMRWEQGLVVTIEIHAEDHGPGIADIVQATSDHFSTGGTLGLGLPSVKRMADEFEITSSPGMGTRVRVVKRLSPRPARPATKAVPAERDAAVVHARRSPPYSDSAAELDAFEIGAHARPRTGEVVSGDRALRLACDGGILLGVLDASGHGPSAHRVASSLEECFEAEGSSDLERLLRRFDETARGTLGAAAGLAFVEASSGRFRYAGVGNTRAGQVGSTSWRGLSRDGVLGSRRLRLNVQHGALAARDVLLLWTDGLPETGQNPRSLVTGYRSAAEIASSAILHYARGYDDAACLVLRWRG